MQSQLSYTYIKHLSLKEHGIKYLENHQNSGNPRDLAVKDVNL